MVCLDYARRQVTGLKCRTNNTKFKIWLTSHTFWSIIQMTKMSSDAKFSWKHMQRFANNNFQESQSAHGIRHRDNGSFPWYVSRNSRRHQLPIFLSKWLKRLLAKHVKNEVSFPPSQQTMPKEAVFAFILFSALQISSASFRFIRRYRPIWWEKTFSFFIDFCSWNRKCFSTKCSTVVYLILFRLSKVKQFSSRGLMT